MGHIREGFGKVCVESRRESFYLHIDYPSDHPLHDLWTEYPHPEIEYEDLDDLIAALQDLRSARGNIRAA